MRIFKSIWPINSKVEALLCDIFISRGSQDTFKGCKISKNEYGGRQEIKFENLGNCLTFDIWSSLSKNPQVNFVLEFLSQVKNVANHSFDNVNETWTSTLEDKNRLLEEKIIRNYCLHSRVNPTKLFSFQNGHFSVFCLTVMQYFLMLHILKLKSKNIDRKTNISRIDTQDVYGNKFSSSACFWLIRPILNKK